MVSTLKKHEINEMANTIYCVLLFINTFISLIWRGQLANTLKFCHGSIVICMWV